MKELAVSMEKDHDFADGEATRYNILAYFKEQEAEKNRILNAAVEKAIGSPAKVAGSPTAASSTASTVAEKPMTLSEQVTLGILNPAPSAPVATENTNTNNKSIKKEIKQTVENIRAEGSRIIREHEFCVTDLLLCFIAFLLFVLIIIRD